MANEEQLKLLRQGVEVWNQWRQEHPDEEIDLAGASLARADLGWADLGEAHLEGARLEGANLRGADLRGADLRKAILYEANLMGAELGGADLREAELGKAELGGAHLIGATLTGADLEGAHLFTAHLEGASLEEADLRRANLKKAHLAGADLAGASLEGAYLVQTTFCEADITGVTLYGTARDDWIIDGIKCDYVFWDRKPRFYDKEKEKEKQWELEHLTPKDRDFEPGEFEALYKQLPTFEYYFKHGFTPLDPVIMDNIVQAINERNPTIELKLDSFHSRGQPHAVFTVLHKEAIEEALKQITTDYEMRLKILEGQRDQLMKVIAMIGSGGITIHDIDGGVNIIAKEGDIVAGNKEQRSITTGRDYMEQVKGDVTTGDSDEKQPE